jgi:hypothetical protein
MGYTFDAGYTFGAGRPYQVEKFTLQTAISQNKFPITPPEKALGI